MCVSTTRKVTAQPRLSSQRRTHLTQATRCSAAVTHFHSRGGPLRLLSNQVDLFVFVFHVFFGHIIHPPWASCRKQQRLGVVLRTWK